MSSHSFSVATFNTNGIRARLHIILPWLEKNPVDCLCIQETKVQDKDFPKEAFTEQGLNVEFRGQKAYNGVAVVSPHPIKVLFDGFPSQESDVETRARQLCVDIKGVTVLNSYVPQGRSLDSPEFQKKLSWFERIGEFLDSVLDLSRFLWCGDLNVAPEPLDVYSPETKGNHVCFHESVRHAFKQVLARGMKDCFRIIHPNEPDHYSFFDYRIPRAVERRLGWRIDHIVASDSFAQQLQDSYIDLEPRKMNKPSDHTFVVARFSF